MAGPVPVTPGVVEAASPDDARRIEEWALRARAELTRLSLAVRTAEAKVARAEVDADDLRPPRPDTLLAVVDATLATARRKAQDAVEAARREADTVVGVAARLAADTVRQAGLDPSTVGSVRPRRTGLGAHTVLVPSADQLWDRLVEDRDGSGREPVGPVAPVAPGEATERDERVEGDGRADSPTPSSALHHAPPVGRAAAPGGPPLPAPLAPSNDMAHPGHPAPTADVPSEAVVAAPDVAGRDGGGTPDAARVYEMFWARVPDDHPVRARLRLRPARGR